jgi:hypothetical protein
MGKIKVQNVSRTYVSDTFTRELDPHDVDQLTLSPVVGNGSITVSQVLAAKHVVVDNVYMDDAGSAIVVAHKIVDGISLPVLQMGNGSGVFGALDALQRMATAQMRP